MTLQRIETKRGHKYTLDRRPVPGVTTLLNGGIPKPQLTYWAAKQVAEFVADNEETVANLRAAGRGPLIAALKASPWESRDRAAVRGTEVHALAEQLVKGEPVEVPEHLAGHVEAYVRFLDEWEPTPVAVERPVASRRWWYAGTFDLIADMAGDRWMLDVKTASGVYGENALQTDAYRQAEFMLNDEGVEVPLPEGITRLGVIHVRADSYDLVPLDSTGAPFKDFLHAAWTAKATDRIRGYVHEPLLPPSREGAA